MDAASLFALLEKYIAESAAEVVAVLGYGRASARKRYAKGLGVAIEQRLTSAGLPCAVVEDWEVRVTVGEKQVSDKPFPLVVALRVQGENTPLQASPVLQPPKRENLYPLLPIDISTASKRPFGNSAIQAAQARSRAIGAPAVVIVNFGRAQPRFWYSYRQPTRYAPPASASSSSDRALPSRGDVPLGIRSDNEAALIDLIPPIDI